MTKQGERFSGQCHCGTIRYEAAIDLSGAFRCNCTICTKLGSTVAPTPPASFRLLAGNDALVQYRFGLKRIERNFCRHCGVHCFAHVHADGEDFIGINVNTLEGVEVAQLAVVYFDGRHDIFEPCSSPQPIGVRAKA